MNELNVQEERVFLFSDKNYRELLSEEITSPGLIIEQPVSAGLNTDLCSFFETSVFRLILIDFDYLKKHSDLKFFFKWLKKTSKKAVLLIKPDDEELVFRHCISPSSFLILPAENRLLRQLLAENGKRFSNHPLQMELNNVQNMSRFFPGELQKFLGNSLSVYALKQKVMAVSPSDLTVLLLGENGTGKTYLAQMIHKLSRRKNFNFVAVNMAEIPEELAEAQLFGTIQGAFTDSKNMKGYFDEADGGTLFLDEIGELSLSMQAKLLRVLETGIYRPVGSMKEKKSDVRFICATNKDLKQMCRDGTFRTDLYYRIADFVFSIEPLRNRISDIRLYAERFLNHTGKHLSPDALKKMEGYDWPGNIRQLNKCIKRADLLCTDEEISEDEIIF